MSNLDEVNPRTMISYKISAVGATENLTLYYANKQQYIYVTPSGFNVGWEHPTGGYTPGLVF